MTLVHTDGFRRKPELVLNMDDTEPRPEWWPLLKPDRDELLLLLLWLLLAITRDEKADSVFALMLPDMVFSSNMRSKSLFSSRR